ncbi:hypothetical protein KEM54_005119 [Ascosphaera aggregata]|nr:hypothetical protein KEM54_005119 [Ascosphaera aggregata]
MENMELPGHLISLQRNSFLHRPGFCFISRSAFWDASGEQCTGWRQQLMEKTPIVTQHHRMNKAPMPVPVKAWKVSVWGFVVDHYGILGSKKSTRNLWRLSHQNQKQSLPDLVYRGSSSATDRHHFYIKRLSFSPTTDAEKVE